MNLTNFSKEVHKNARIHGWWDKERSFGEIIALCHSELSEALEEYRDGKATLYFENSTCKECGGKCISDAADECPDNPAECGAFECGKPEGVAVELADCIIRILDYCGYAEIDIEDVIQRKHKYNRTRPYRHGGKKL